jgi:hypothetical protein
MSSSSNSSYNIIAVSGFGVGETLDGEKETMKHNVKALIDKLNRKIKAKKNKKTLFLEEESPVDAICTHVVSNSTSSK